MATDTERGLVELFEDFLVTAIADLPEIDIQAVTGETRAVVAAGVDGRLRLAIASSNDDDVGAVTFGDRNFTAGCDLFMEARLFFSVLTDIKIFVGFGDTIASADETTFSATTDTITIDTMTDAIGILYDEDSTTKQFWAVAGKTDAVTVDRGLGTATKSELDAAEAVTIGVFLSADRKVARFYWNGKEIYGIESATTLVGAVPLVAGVWAYEQAAAVDIDVDYVYARKDRSTT